MKNTKELIQQYNLRLTKSLGQNFLRDENIVKNIVASASICKKDLVIEVGPGVGSMTGELLEQAGMVAAVEIDRHLIPVLQETFQGSDHFMLIHEDILKLDIRKDVIEKIQKDKPQLEIISVKVVSNLPYYITTPVIMKFLEDTPGIDTMVFMVQKEVADRMCAAPGGKDYGALSVAVQYYSTPRKMFDVPPHCFIPQPDVDSTVIRLDIHSHPPVELLEEDMFFRTVKAAFGQRRKTLVNALSNAGHFHMNKEEIKAILKNMGLREDVRGEVLTIMQFAELSNAFSKKKCELHADFS